MKLKKEIIGKLIQKLNKDKVGEIKIIGDKNKEPMKIAYKGNRKSYTPDVVAFYDEKRDIFSVETKINKAILPELISKWILFSLEARRHNGKFYVVVPKEKSAKCQEIINSKQLSAELLAV